MNRAEDYYWTGRRFHLLHSQEANAEARRMFDRAIALDPAHARAHGHKSYTLVQAWRNGWYPVAGKADPLVAALRLAQTSVTLGPDDYENHWSLAIVHVYRREFGKGFGAYDKANRQIDYAAKTAAPIPDADRADFLAEFARSLLFIGDVKGAIRRLKAASRLNPFPPGWYDWILGWALYDAGEYGRAHDVLSAAKDPPRRLFRRLAATCVRIGDRRGAVEAACRVLEQDPAYRIHKEDVWPYKNMKPLKDFQAALRETGLPS